MTKRGKATRPGRRPLTPSIFRSPSIKNPDFTGRIRKLRALMESKGLDACLMNSKNDIFYYSGEEIRDFSFLLVPKNSRPTIFLTSLNNYVQPTERFGTAYIRGISDVAKSLKPFRLVGFDEYGMNCSTFSEFRKSGSVLKPSASIIKEPRMVKDGYELGMIAKAAALARKAVSGLGALAGKTEISVLNKIELSFRNAGAKPSFETIVASGKHSAFVHHITDSKIIGRKELAIVDCGALVKGYCSDMTRTFCRRPGPKEKQITENIKGIQAELIDMAREGVRYDDVEKLFEALLAKKGYKVMHSFGHGIGTGVHERPSKGDVLKEGMVITVEPGAYVKGFGGCRIEDMIVVRKGKSRILTKISKD
jgi:Xaa-Pro aminopeptidase